MYQAQTYDDGYLGRQINDHHSLENLEKEKMQDVKYYELLPRCIMPDATKSVKWNDVTKKGARSVIDNSDFGEVQEVGQHYVPTQKEVGSKEKFFIPKYLVRGFNGRTLWFNASQDQLQTWKRNASLGYKEYSRHMTQQSSSDIETRIPFIEDPLNVSKPEFTYEATTKKDQPIRPRQSIHRLQKRSL